MKEKLFLLQQAFLYWAASAICAIIKAILIVVSAVLLVPWLFVIVFVWCENKRSELLKKAPMKNHLE